MDNQYLDEATFRELVYKITTGTEPECREDREVLNDILPSFHAYVDAVIRGETELTLNPGTDGANYREMVMRYDQARHSCHEAVIVNVRMLNRLAELHKIPPVYTGDTTQRSQVAAFCLELDQYLFVNRRMKLS